MSSSIEQLQQLSTDELCILCLDYGIPRYRIANLERRQLELRLHVAIISERARMRALDRFYGDRDDEYAYDNAFNGKYGSNELNDPRLTAKFRADFTAWKYLNMRRQRKFPLLLPRITSSRSRGGVDLYKKIALNPYEFDAVSTVNSEDFEEGEEYEEESEESDNWEATDDEISRQSSDVHSDMSEESEFMEADEQSTERQSSGINIYKPGSQKNQRKQAIAHGNNAQFSDSEESEFMEADDQARKRQSCGSYAQSSQKSQPKQAIDHGNKSQFSQGDENALNRTERFNWMSDSNLDLSQERESDPSSEHEICTYNFLEGCQGDIDESATVSKLQPRLQNNHEAIGASRQLSQAQLSPWRYLIDLIFSNVQEKLIADNVGYSILCCTMVICTYVGFKLIK